MGTLRGAVVRRWLEVLLPLYTFGLLVVLAEPEYTPSVLNQSMSESLLPWIGWAVVGAMSGILGLWVLIVAFFLFYSPIYLAGKSGLLIGQGGWVDRRELQFYIACFLLLCLLITLAWLWGWRVAVGALLLLGGCGPVFWRHLV
jgi:hypothetical protein